MSLIAAFWRRWWHILSWNKEKLTALMIMRNTLSGFSLIDFYFPNFLRLFVINVLANLQIFHLNFLLSRVFCVNFSFFLLSEFFIEIKTGPSAVGAVRQFTERLAQGRKTTLAKRTFRKDELSPMRSRREKSRSPPSSWPSKRSFHSFAFPHMFLNVFLMFISTLPFLFFPSQNVSPPHYFILSFISSTKKNLKSGKFKILKSFSG